MCAVHSSLHWCDRHRPLFGCDLPFGSAVWSLASQYLIATCSTINPFSPNAQRVCRCAFTFSRKCRLALLPPFCLSESDICVHNQYDIGLHLHELQDSASVSAVEPRDFSFSSDRIWQDSSILNTSASSSEGSFFDPTAVKHVQYTQISLTVELPFFKPGLFGFRRFHFIVLCRADKFTLLNYLVMVTCNQVAEIRTRW